MQMDILTVGVGFVSFGIFLIIQVITFRWVKPELVLRFLGACVFAIAVLPLLLMRLLFINKAMDASPCAWILASLLALIISGLVSLFYVLCVFGPYETSVRMRLVREIGKGGPEGITLPELLERYNHETILKVRLRRLLGSGDIIENNGLYQAGRKGNLFFIFDAVAGVIKKWIGR